MNRPLVVDLDGTLIFTDLLYESFMALLKTRPYLVFLIPFWLLRGKAFLKKEIAKRIDLDVANLPLNEPLLNWLKEQKASGRMIVLCTASDQIYADVLSRHLGIFHECYASDGITNLSSQTKAKFLCEKFGHRGFDYIGNSWADVSVWEHAYRSLVVSNSQRFIESIKDKTDISDAFDAPKMSLKTWLKMLRVHQWLKNILVFVPLLAAHQIHVFDSWVELSLVFFSFSFCASSVYILNDLLDLSDDRAHPRKRFRPFASGGAPIWLGCVLAPLLLILSITLATFVNGTFIAWLGLYFGMTCLYSWLLKRLVLVDCFVLAILYTLRVIAGAVAVDILLSPWLLAFSIFFFLSLAFLKRYVELLDRPSSNELAVNGRGYFASDANLISQLGIAAGFASVLILALYLNSQVVLILYSAPQFIWFAIPTLLFWISWMWLKAHRGQMHDDPLMFAVKDSGSQALGLLFVGIFLLAATQ